MKYLAITAASVLALVGFSGCQSVNTVQRAEPQASPNMINDQRIVTDKSLARKLQIISLNETTVSGDLLKVQATLQNTSRSTRTFNYQFEWIREDGMVQSGPTSIWKPLSLQGGEVRSISGVGPSPQIVDFRLKLQEN